MPRPKETTGRSKRTPAKHDLMNKLYGREVGSAMRNPAITDLVWPDLTAGDGVASEADQAWHRSCSPGILAHHARWAYVCKPITILLHERAARTYATLLTNLTEQLPHLGYQQLDEAEWSAREGLVRLHALHRDGQDADLSIITRSTAVMLNNDPNAIIDWAMPEWMPEQIRKATPWFLGISTMGCNAAGLKRLSREERHDWYGHIESMIRGLPRYHDIYLAAIERDASQWAYLVTSPTAVSYTCDWRTETEDAARSAFNKLGMSLRTGWWRTQPQTFTDLCHELFLTRGEREGGDAA